MVTQSRCRKNSVQLSLSSRAFQKPGSRMRPVLNWVCLAFLLRATLRLELLNFPCDLYEMFRKRMVRFVSGEDFGSPCTQHVAKTGNDLQDR